MPKKAAKKAAAKKAPAPPPQAQGAPGADSNDLVDSNPPAGGPNLMQRAAALFGTQPVFWGRYFKKPGNASSEQYQPQHENAVLNAAGIRVLPLARQTNHVGGSEALGRQEGRGYVDALFWAFGKQHLAQAGGTFYLFLDVEPSTPLSVPYYTGWASEIESYSRAQTGNAVTILPCVYVNQGDLATLGSIRTAMHNGIKCLGLWTAHYLGKDNTGCRRPGPWDPTMAVPASSPAPVLIWQYIGDCYGKPGVDGTFDGNQANPGLDLQNDILRFLIPPPAGFPAA